LLTLLSEIKSFRQFYAGDLDKQQEFRLISTFAQTKIRFTKKQQKTFAPDLFVKRPSGRRDSQSLSGKMDVLWKSAERSVRFAERSIRVKRGSRINFPTCCSQIVSL
jgi:hypothetical protein